MSHPTIGKLERVPLREVWRHEALDFTQWLQNNIAVLNDILDLTKIESDRMAIEAADFDLRDLPSAMGKEQGIAWLNSQGVVAVLPNWDKSPGARAEVMLAQWRQIDIVWASTGLPVYYFLEVLA